MGIDPGTSCVGYGVIDKKGSDLQVVDFGTIRTKSGAPLPERLKTIFEQLSSIISKYSPETFAIENVFVGKGPRSSIKIGEGRGVILLCAAMSGGPIAEYTATNVKMAVVGNGHASKEQVQKMVGVILGLDEPPKAEDAADALAIAICHCHRSKIPNEFQE